MMRFLEILRISFDALLRNKMRSLLTMLGIIIGVGAVIAMVAIGQGAQVSVDAQISTLGTNVLMVFPGSTARGGVMSGAGTGTTLTEEDGQAIKEQCPAVAYVSPQLRSGAQVVYGDLNWSTSLQGGSPDFFAIRDWRIDQGDLFTDQDVRAATKVCLIGQTVVQQLFADENPISQTIRIRNIPFRVVGTLKSKGQNMMGQDQDDIILIPYTTLQKRLVGNVRSWGFIVSARLKQQMVEAQDEITQLLRARHKIGITDDNDFTIRTQTEIAEASSATSKIMTTLLASIASVSLIVGGIGIMNIMLVSVTERTREIGVRMSIGARKYDILVQFLMEAIVLSLLGGLIGIGLGVLGSNLVSRVAGWPTFVTANSIILAVIFSTAVGVFFGYYPARKASLLNPIEALRYE
ncbi:MAG: ABC transporter permease [Ignavibacteriae bacterium]|nr:ABC transporter permease [Ignavibacteria bacterium]MBI3365172.1 ABC transporter permease [Ignavibacteriota bacterium]